MKITYSKVTDKNKITDDVISKIMYSNKIVEFFTPMFYEEMRKKQTELKEVVAVNKKIKEGISSLTSDIKKKSEEAKIEKIKSKILNLIKSNPEIENRKDFLLTLDGKTLPELMKSFKILQKSVNKKQNKG